MAKRAAVERSQKPMLESRIDLIKDSPGILLQACLSTAEDRRTCLDCSPFVTSCATFASRVSSLSRYAIELDDIAYDMIKQEQFRNIKEIAGKRYYYRVARPLVIAIECDA